MELNMNDEEKKRYVTRLEFIRAITSRPRMAAPLNLAASKPVSSGLMNLYMGN